MEAGKKRKRNGGQAQKPYKRKKIIRDEAPSFDVVLKHIIKAAKKARTFETQKVVRKIKQVENPKDGKPVDASAVKDLEASLSALKDTDVHIISSFSLHSLISKLPDVKSSEAFQAFAGDNACPSLPEDPKSHSGKAYNRILANKTLREHLNTVKTQLASSTPVVPFKSDKPERSQKFSKKEKLPREHDSDDHDDFFSGSESENEKSSEDSSASIASTSRLPEDDEISVASYSSQSDLDAEPKPKATKTKSAFLPSLAAGFTMGDSDASDFEMDDVTDAKPERKNRRGQRARQKIWERKYGKDAKHVQRQKEAEKSAQAIKDSKKRKGRRTAEGEGDAKPAPKKKEKLDWNKLPIAVKRPWDGSNKAPQENAAPATAPKETEKKAPVHDGGRRYKKEEKVHPSWEAKKKAKDRASMGVAGGGFQGTKITFD